MLPVCPPLLTRWVRRLLIDAALIFLGLYLIGLFGINRVMFHPHPPDYTWRDAHIVNLGTEQRPLAGLWITNAASGTVILYSHGNAEDLGDVREIVEILAETGASVLAYDYPGYGLSAGHPSEESCYEAAERAYRFLTEQNTIAPSAIIIMGRSIGTGPACYLAEKHPVGGLIFESGFISAPRVVTRVRLLPTDPFPNIARIAHIRCPKLFIHGTADRVVPFWHGTYVYEHAPEPKRHLWVKNAGHDDLILVTGETAYREAIRAFLSETVK